MSDMGASAAKAYMQTVQTMAGKAGGAPSAEETKGSGFGDILGQAIQSVTSAGNTAETGIANAAMGKGDLVDVATAVAAAEATLETVVAVRDEVIKAYQDIMRMPF
jgi:flagellar hook-basal body complex protein FliE